MYPYFYELVGRDIDAAFMQIFNLTQNQLDQKVSDAPHFQDFATELEEMMKKKSRMARNQPNEFKRKKIVRLGASSDIYPRIHDNYDNVHLPISERVSPPGRNIAGEVLYVYKEVKNKAEAVAYERMTRFIFKQRGYTVCHDKSNFVKDQKQFMDDDGPGYVYVFIYAEKYIHLMNFIDSAKGYVPLSMQIKHSDEAIEKAMEKYGPPNDLIPGESFRRYNIPIANDEKSNLSKRVAAEIEKNILHARREKMSEP